MKIRQIVVLGAFLLSCVSVIAEEDAAHAAIERTIAASDAECVARQATLADRCRLTDYAALVRTAGGTNVWTAALQKAVDEHEIVVIPAAAERYYIDGSVVVPSNRRIEATGATVALLPGTVTLMLRGASAPDGTFAPLAREGRNDNIAVVGGRWEDWKGAWKLKIPGGRTGRISAAPRRREDRFGLGALFYFGHSDHVTVQGVTFANAKTFAYQTGDGDAHRYFDITFESCCADGLHLNGNLSRVHVKNVKGKVGDDLVALNAYDWMGSSVNFGPIDNVLCEDLENLFEQGSGYPAIRILPAKYRYRDGRVVDCSVSNVIFRRVKGITTYKCYLQTQRYFLGQEPEWGEVGSGDNLYFEDLDIDLFRPIDLLPAYVNSDPVRGHFAAFEFGANLGKVTIRDVKVRFHLDRYPLSHLVQVGPKSVLMPPKDGKGAWEVFNPYLSSRVESLTVKDIRVEGDRPEKLVHVSRFDDVNNDGRSTGCGEIGRLCCGDEAEALRTGFADPPDDAKPRTWWHWMQGLVTKEGITRDLEAMKAVGVGGCTLLDIGFFEKLEGSVHTLSPEWFDCVDHAAKEATRLGLELSVHDCSGWSSSGGPWIRPEFAMKSLEFSETVVTGGACVAVSLPPVRLTDGSRPLWTSDVGVLAFPSLRPDAARIPLVNNKCLHDFDAGGPKRWDFKKTFGSPAAADCVRFADIVDLTDRMSADGTLTWHAPAGEWTVVRFQAATFKSTNVRGSKWGTGLECDKMSKEGVDEAWRGYMAPIMARAKASSATGLRHVLVDSYEVGSHNWTQKMPDEFRALRGYDLAKWIVTFTGRYVGSGDETEKFLEDFRRTVADLNAKWYGGYFSELIHANGLDYEQEAYGGPWDQLWQGQYADCPMGEFWYRDSRLGPGPTSCVGQAATLASVHGRKYAQSEAFTEGFRTAAWGDSPADHKRPGDCAFATGVNRLVFHTYCHQPYETFGPGLTMGICGFMFNRHNTLWELYPGWVKYLSRCQFLLQQGTRVADIVSVGSLDAPCGLPQGVAIPSGFQGDAIPAYQFLRDLDYSDGAFRLPNGRAWRQLVLPETRHVTVAYLEKVKRFREAGASVVLGPKPARAFGLAGGAAADEAVRKLADELWSEPNPKVGVGTPDVRFRALAKDADLRWTHRTTPTHDLYFVANVSEGRTTVRTTAAFRAHGAAELWWPETGRIEPVSSVERDGVSEVELTLPFSTSCFVVFRKDAPARSVAAQPQPTVRTDLSRDWSVTFLVRGEAPFEKSFATLHGFADDNEARVRDFAGTAVYRKTVEVAPGARVRLDLGEVADGCRVFANGIDCGYLWHFPYVVELPAEAVKTGRVELEIRVVTRWVNRILAEERRGVGGVWERYHGRKDMLMAAKLPDDLSWFFTYRARFADDPSERAGLFGPVIIDF